eukprot:Lankesteria_metandrocarpae@DN8210_c0_g1_i1.p1
MVSTHNIATTQSSDNNNVINRTAATTVINSNHQQQKDSTTNPSPSPPQQHLSIKRTFSVDTIKSPRAGLLGTLKFVAVLCVVCTVAIVAPVCWLLSTIFHFLAYVSLLPFTLLWVPGFKLFVVRVYPTALGRYHVRLVKLYRRMVFPDTTTHKPEQRRVVTENTNPPLPCATSITRLQHSQYLRVDLAVPVNGTCFIHVIPALNDNYMYLIVDISG